MTILEAIHEFCAALPRHAPGTAATTTQALRRFGRLSRRMRVVEFGCGTGVATRVLAQRFDGPVVAIDAHEPFLAQLASGLREEGLADRVQTLHADFTKLGEDFGPFELMWAEAAAYVLGFERALSAWGQLLAPGGRLAVTELCYLVEEPSREVTEYVSAIHPTVTTVASNIAIAERAGYRLVDTIPLANKDYRAYYGPVKSRVAEIRAGGEVSAELMAVTAELEHELLLQERYKEQWGWVFFLLEKPAAGTSTTEATASDEDVEPALVDEVELGARMGSSRGWNATRKLDVQVAPANSASHLKHEQRLVELIRICGLSQAERVLSSVEAQVETIIQRGR